MENNFVKAISKDGSFRILALKSTEIVEKARKIHNTSPVCSAALGRALTAASLMGALLKDERHTLTLQIKGNGPAGTILCVADANSNVRGYIANPDIDIPKKPNGKLDVSGVVGTDGYIAVIKDLMLKEPYCGQVPIISGEIAEDIANYFVISEQTPTACALGVLVDVDYSIKAAGGYILQALPNADEMTLKNTELAIEMAPSVTELFDMGLTAEEMIKEVFSVIPLVMIEEFDAEYKCNCSKSRVEKALISIGFKDLSDLVENKENIEVSCQFCDKKYNFDNNDIIKIIDKLKK